MTRLAAALDAQLSPHGWRRTDADVADDPRHWWHDPARARTIGCGASVAWFYDGQAAVFMVLGENPDAHDVIATLYVWRALPARGGA